MVLDRFLQTIEPTNYNEFTDEIRNIIYAALEDYIVDKPFFSLDDFSVYMYDDFLMKTNVSKQNYIRFFIRVDKQQNIKTTTHTLITQSGEVKTTKVKAPEMYLSLEKMKTGLLNHLKNYFNDTTVLWEEKYNIMIQGKHELDDDTIEPFFIMITPCVEHFNDSGEAGIMYYDNSKMDIQIEYHYAAMNNFINKNINTNLLYHNYIVLFKNIFNVSERQRMLPYEIFETLLYNVPDDMFVDLSKDNILKIIHYLQHKPIGQMKGIDDVDYPFTSKYRSMSYVYANKALKVLGNNIKQLNI